MNLQEKTVNLPEDSEWIVRGKGFLSGLKPVIIMGAILFVSAGTFNWPMAWVMLGVLFASTTFVTLFCSPDLITERIQRHSGAKDWDARMVRMMNLIGLLPLMVAGLDIRFGWSEQIPFPMQVAAIGIVILGYEVFSWAMLTNPFFSLVVRIQNEKGHHAVTSGPYRFVRHPGYFGFFLIILAQPIVLGSLWALVPTGLTAAILVVRTEREDETLLTELNGYRAYAQEVRYRLIPTVW